jgi:hypothetical protein
MALGMKKPAILWGCFLWLGCTPAPPPPPVPAITIPDLTLYLAQGRCPDGSPEMGCVADVPQRASDPMLWRKHDYGTPTDGYVAMDGVESDDGTWFATVWSFAPYDKFNSALGDGGEMYVVENGTVRVTATQDGGTPGMQYFVGPKCGGTGWIAFDNKAPTGAWRDTVATLGDQPDPTACPPLNASYTRWRMETLTIPFRTFGFRAIPGPTWRLLPTSSGTRSLSRWRDLAAASVGVVQSLTLRCIVYEHWNGASIASAVDVEQAVWCAGWGRVWWAKYSPGPVTDLGYRLPAIPWPAPPERPDFNIKDARLNTNIVAADGSMSATVFGWPPQ